jgi:hypothetical protein
MYNFGSKKEGIYQLLWKYTASPEKKKGGEQKCKLQM